MEKNKQTISINDIIIERAEIKFENKETPKTKDGKILREDTHNNADENSSGVGGVGTDDM